MKRFISRLVFFYFVFLLMKLIGIIRKSVLYGYRFYAEIGFMQINSDKLFPDNLIQ